VLLFAVGLTLVVDLWLLSFRVSQKRSQKISVTSPAAATAATQLKSESFKLKIRRIMPDLSRIAGEGFLLSHYPNDNISRKAIAHLLPLLKV